MISRSHDSGSSCHSAAGRRRSLTCVLVHSSDFTACASCASSWPASACRLCDARSATTSRFLLRARARIQQNVDRGERRHCGVFDDHAAVPRGRARGGPTPRARGDAFGPRGRAGAIAKPAPAAAAAAAAPPDAAATEAELASSLGAAAAAEALALNAGGGDDGAAAEVVLAPDEDKERRRAVHQLVKRLLPALCSDTVDRDGGKCVRLLPKALAARRADGGGGKRQRVDRREEWPAEAGGRKHLGFTLYKENRDTHDALAQLARALRLPPNALGFAGTKDKRAVTAQRVTAFKVTAERLRQLMAAAPFGESIVVGDDLTYDEEPLRLGALAGNRFTIVLRDATCSAADLEAAAAALGEAGLVNYFGLQRFGSNAAAGTHAVGAATLRSDGRRRADLVMAPFPHDSGRGDTGERQAREAWAATRDPDAALPHLPRWMGAERSLLEGNKQLGPTNGCGALMKLPRTLRMMYLHAFGVPAVDARATERIRLRRRRAVAGASSPSTARAAAARRGRRRRCRRGADAAGGAARRGDAAADDGGIGAVHVVSEAEAAAGAPRRSRCGCRRGPRRRTSLPTSARDFIRASLEEHGLTPGSFDHHSKEISLKGAYAAQFGAQFFGAQFGAHSSATARASLPAQRETPPARAAGGPRAAGCGTATDGAARAHRPRAPPRRLERGGRSTARAPRCASRSRCRRRRTRPLLHASVTSSSTAVANQGGASATRARRARARRRR